MASKERQAAEKSSEKILAAMGKIRRSDGRKAGSDGQEKSKGKENQKSKETSALLSVVLE